MACIKSERIGYSVVFCLFQTFYFFASYRLLSNCRSCWKVPKWRRNAENWWNII